MLLSIPRLARLLLAPLLLTLACSGGRVATPMPEPPLLVPSLVGLPTEGAGVIVVSSGPFPLPIQGRPGAVDPRATVRITDLEDIRAPLTSVAQPNGAFLLQITVNAGDELRVQALVGDERSVPLDLRVIGPAEAPTLLPSARHSCVEFEPPLSLGFSGQAQVALEVSNGCAAAIALSNPRFRLATGEYQLSTSLPLELQPAERASLELTRIDVPNPEEQVLFLDVDLSGVVIRYPVTLFPLP